MQKPHLHTHQIIRVLQKKVGSFSVAGGSQKSNADLFTTNAQQMRIYFLCWLSTCRNAYLFQPNLCPPSAHSHHFDSLTFGCRRRQVFLHYFCFCALSAFDDQDVVGWRKKKMECKVHKERAASASKYFKMAVYHSHTCACSRKHINDGNGEVDLWRAERNNDEDVRETKRHCWLLLLLMLEASTQFLKCFHCIKVRMFKDSRWNVIRVAAAAVVAKDNMMAIEQLMHVPPHLCTCTGLHELMTRVLMSRTNKRNNVAGHYNSLPAAEGNMFSIAFFLRHHFGKDSMFHHKIWGTK